MSRWNFWHQADSCTESAFLITIKRIFEALTKSMNMYIWGIGTVNQLFIRGSYTQIKFSKKRNSQWQKFILCDCDL